LLGFINNSSKGVVIILVKLKKQAFCVGHTSVATCNGTNKQVLNVDISKNYVPRIFKGWRWSWKIFDIRKVEKFTPANIYKYIQHVKCV